MSMNETTSSTSTDTGIISYSVKYILLTVLVVISALTSLLIFIYFACRRTARAQDHNRSILVLLTINFLLVVSDFPTPINFFRLGGIIQPATPAYCIWWNWYEFSLNNINAFLMAWISIERHLFIFHSNIIPRVASCKRTLFRIAPLAFCLFWGPLFFTIVIIISPTCTTTWVFDRLQCGLPCYIVTNWGSFDLFFHVVFPISLLIIANFALAARVIYQQWMMNQRIRRPWRRQKKMILQLGSISLLYLAPWLPIMISFLGQIYIDPSFLANESDIISYCTYFVPICLPFILLMSMPELIKDLQTILYPNCRRQQTTVAPIALQLHPPEGTNNIASGPTTVGKN